MVFCYVGPKMDHQLIGFTPEDEKVNTSHEVRKIFMYFFITNHFGVVAAAIDGNVDSVDYISHLCRRNIPIGPIPSASESILIESVINGNNVRGLDNPYFSIQPTLPEYRHRGSLKWATPK